MRNDSDARQDVDDLLARYRASHRDDSDLRAALQRISSPLSTGITSVATRPGGSTVDYAKGPVRRLADPREEDARRLTPSEVTLGERLRSAAAGGADVTGLVGAGHVAGPTRSATGSAASDATLDLGGTQLHDNSIVGTGSDFVPVEVVHHYTHNYYHQDHCWYGTSWWYKPWSFGVYLSWPFYYNSFEPLWLTHPIYGTYPWYGGYSFAYCGHSNWYYGSYNSWSWGLSSAWSPNYQEPATVVYVENEPQVVYVERAPEYIVAGEGSDSQPYDESAAPVGGFDVAPTGAAPVPLVVGAESSPAIGVAADRYLTLGDRAFRDARYADAVHYYTKAAALEPDVPVLQLLLSDAHFATGDYEAAARAIRIALTGDPMLVRSEVDKREFYTEKRAFDRQLAVCELYLADHPIDSEARLVLAVNLLFSGAPASAVDLLESDLAFGLSDDPIAQLVLATARDRQYGKVGGSVGRSDDSSANG